MAKYAKGKHAVLISDRSGWKIKYKNARTEWQGYRVSKEEWEAKQPQLDPQKYLKRASAQGNVLYDPRTDNDSVPTTVRLGSLHGKYSGQAAIYFTQPNIWTTEDTEGFELTTGIGTLIIPAVTEGKEATTSQGTLVLSAVEFPSGIAATTGQGTVTIPGIEVPDGMYVTAQQGTILIHGDVAVTGFEITTAIGDVVITLVESVTMTGMTASQGEVIIPAVVAGTLTMTAQQGTIAVTSPSWGTFDWGHDEWGSGV